MRVCVLTALLVLATFAGCSKDDGTEVPEDTFLILRKANGTLMGVRDAETAKAAQPVLRQLTTQLRDAAAKAKKAGKSGVPATEDDRAAAASREVTDIANQVKSDPAINGVIGNDLDAFMKVMTTGS